MIKMQFSSVPIDAVFSRNGVLYLKQEDDVVELRNMAPAAITFRDKDQVWLRKTKEERNIERKEPL